MLRQAVCVSDREAWAAHGGPVAFQIPFQESLQPLSGDLSAFPAPSSRYGKAPGPLPHSRTQGPICKLYISKTCLCTQAHTTDWQNCQCPRAASGTVLLSKRQHCHKNSCSASCPPALRHMQQVHLIKGGVAPPSQLLRGPTAI